MSSLEDETYIEPTQDSVAGSLETDGRQSWPPELRLFDSMRTWTEISDGVRDDLSDGVYDSQPEVKQTMTAIGSRTLALANNFQELIPKSEIANLGYQWTQEKHYEDLRDDPELLKAELERLSRPKQVATVLQVWKGRGFTNRRLAEVITSENENRLVIKPVADRVNVIVSCDEHMIHLEPFNDFHSRTLLVNPQRRSEVTVTVCLPKGQKPDWDAIMQQVQVEAGIHDANSTDGSSNPRQSTKKYNTRRPENFERISDFINQNPGTPYTNAMLAGLVFTDEARAMAWARHATSNKSDILDHAIPGYKIWKENIQLGKGPGSTVVICLPEGEEPDWKAIEEKVRSEAGLSKDVEDYLPPVIGDFSDLERKLIADAMLRLPEARSYLEKRLTADDITILKALRLGYTVQQLTKLNSHIQLDRVEKILRRCNRMVGVVVEGTPPKESA